MHDEQFAAVDILLGFWPALSTFPCTLQPLACLAVDDRQQVITDWG